MGTPYKMKYTNGKKADATAFPFKPSPGKQLVPSAMSPQMQETFRKKVDDVIEKKVETAIDPETI